MLDNKVSKNELEITGPLNQVRPRVNITGRKLEDIYLVLQSLFSHNK